MSNIFASDNVKYFHGTYIERISLKFSVSNMPGGCQKCTPVGRQKFELALEKLHEGKSSAE